MSGRKRAQWSTSSPSPACAWRQTGPSTSPRPGQVTSARTPAESPPSGGTTPAALTSESGNHRHPRLVFIWNVVSPHCFYAPVHNTGRNKFPHDLLGNVHTLMNTHTHTRFPPSFRCFFLLTPLTHFHINDDFFSPPLSSFSPDTLSAPGDPPTPLHSICETTHSNLGIVLLLSQILFSPQTLLAVVFLLHTSVNSIWMRHLTFC